MGEPRNRVVRVRCRHRGQGIVFISAAASPEARIESSEFDLNHGVWSANA